MPQPKLSFQNMVNMANQPPPAPVEDATAQYAPQPDPSELTPLDVAQAQNLYITQPKSMSTPPPMPNKQSGWKK